MNLSSMDYFVTLARTRSFTKAAQQLHITQQSLSAHIASLEQELGCLLLVRHVPLELTYAGSVFLRYAACIQQEVQNLRREFCDITENQRGLLRIGIATTRSRAMMPRLIRHFQLQYPNVEIELKEATNQTLHRKLLNGEIDLAIANFPDSLHGVELVDFYDEEVVLLICRTLLERVTGKAVKELERHIRKGDISPLERCPFILGNEEDIAGSIGRKMIEQAGFRPVTKATSDNVETLLSLCVDGAGACFCPANLARAVLSNEQMSALKVFHLGDTAKYPIRFGFLKSSYQWSMITEFIRIAAGLPVA